MLKCIAIDDEPSALKLLEHYCRRHGGMELEVHASPLLGMQRLRECRPDILFFNIRQDEASGMALARQLPPDFCSLIFTSDSAECALEAFNLDAVDFLHKPFGYERFEQSIRKSVRWLLARDLLSASATASPQLLLKSGYRSILLPTAGILYIEALDNYVKVHASDGSSLLSKTTLQAVQRQLPGGEFIRIHRSYLVPKSRIARFSHTEVVLAKSGRVLPVGKTYARSVVSLLEETE